MKQSHELVFIPFPLVGHFAAALEMAKLITRRDPGRVSVTILLMEFESFDAGQDTGSDSIRFVALPSAGLSSSGGVGSLFFEFVEAHAPLIRSVVHDLLTRSHDSVRLAGFVLDMFCTQMIDVANEFGVPSYLLYTSGAATLGFVLHVQYLHDHQGLNLNEFKNSDTELEVPSFAHPVPGKVFPSVITGGKEGPGAEIFLHHVRRFRQCKGILVNSFLELEPHAIHSLSGTAVPRAYPVGPILNPGSGSGSRDSSAIMSWLDDQPPSSVVFLCFGSMGAFGADQIKEIARGLELSGHRFLWSLRRQLPADGAALFPTDYENVEDDLPEGFIHRTARIGKVIGWAPQVAILAHPAVGGFVSHCGWNSTLESLWHGVPVATWPLFAEQQLNAFLMVRELELAVEIRIDYGNENSDCVVSGEEIETALKTLMDMESEVRKKRAEIKEISRKVMMEGGSSHISLGCFIEDIANKPVEITDM